MTWAVHLTDLHLDGQPENLDTVRRHWADHEVDVILLGGDTGSPDDLQRVIRVRDTDHPNAPLAWIVGNHELWHHDYTDLWKPSPWPGPTDSPGSIVPLEIQNLELPECTIIGSYGHYDFSAGDPKIPLETYESYRYQNMGWNDIRINRLGRTNPQIAEEIAHHFSSRLQAALEREHPYLALFHTLPIPELNAWDKNTFYAAYGTNKALGEALFQAPRKPKAILTGHTHKAIDFDHQGVKCINTGSDYFAVRVAFFQIETGRYFFEGADPHAR